MKKIMIIGSGGSGKSTLARRLGQQLGLPVFHLDAYMWKPGWILSTREEQSDIQSQLMTHTEWIIDGNYSGTMDVRIKEADTIIFLDISRRICLYQVIKRYLTNRNTVRPDMAEGCEEKIDKEFLSWVWNFPRNKRPALIQRLNELKDSKQVIILHSPQQIEKWLRHL
ncbi:DNA topology modulation protein [Macrococcus brunensis]|uniref:DNA topology modulation protein n=1 Tax=Macrococcus brunensis TaxID=198483 RepID=A0A4R6BAV4_9STAP|nr:DNA topology modulation protein [Macrococcus brunensis]TDL93442.1 DNA topology modulation protein [Macrococcus brunensis]ULG74637.1 DNA topology modulation protein [Macrococcus brunensis]